MTDREAKILHKERTALLDKWTEASSQDKLKILVRLMDIDDDLLETGSKTAMQAQRRYIRPAAKKPRKKVI